MIKYPIYKKWNRLGNDYGLVIKFTGPMEGKIMYAPFASKRNNGDVEINWVPITDSDWIDIYFNSYIII